ncbi:MAG: type II toxin-antitoxin system prevent-host-death family antitoxin [Deltaproteobacteria bacterium]|nr:type II toxin-antitoxin system prevent-host-death family antitoxin [Deltaproteobacteria bacterium]
MKTAAVAELKARLSRYLSRVKAGEEILVTERNVPIARLVPVAGTLEGLEGLRDLERQGLVRLSTGTLPKGFWKLPRDRDPRALVRRAVTKERGEGW